ncbi:MAG TPA: response regulator transcription factor [Melioribacteraceae bacterium]|nr:response regulator transcription factor [Melioribacteraceae bacterium]
MKKILLVDDSPEIVTSLIRWLNLLQNFEIIGVAETEASAVQLFNDNLPDIVILDINLKKGTGLDVLSEIKRKSPETKVIILTNYSIDIFKKTSIGFGADYFYDKTNDIEQLIKTLSKLKL